MTVSSSWKVLDQTRFWITCTSGSHALLNRKGERLTEVLANQLNFIDELKPHLSQKRIWQWARSASEPEAHLSQKRNWARSTSESEAHLTWSKNCLSLFRSRKTCDPEAHAIQKRVWATTVHEVETIYYTCLSEISNFYFVYRIDIYLNWYRIKY